MQLTIKSFGWAGVTVRLMTFTIAALAFVTIAANAARAETWQIDPVHTNISFSAVHMMVSHVRGEFDKFNGSVSANGNDPSSVKIEATIDAASINTRSEMRDKDLKGPNFLDAAKYPTITFKSTKIEPSGDGKWKVTGDLTLHGVTKPVTLEVEGPTPEVKDPFGNTRRGASATTKINRQDFGITYNKALDSGGLVVSNEIAISIDVEAIKK
jgi:polyisoprenoid-binding protein YceI